MSDDNTTPAVPEEGPPKAQTGSPDLLTSLDVTPPTLVRAMTIGALAYVVAWVSASLGTLLTLVGASLNDDVSWWWLLTAPGQVVAMAFRSPAVGSFDSGDSDFPMSGEFSVTTVPLTILLIAIATVLLLSRRDERRGPASTVKGMVSLAVASALTFIVLAFVIALVLTPSFGDDTSYRASQFQLVLFGVAVLTVAALVGRRPLALWSVFRSIPVAALDAGRAVLVHFLVFLVLSVPAIAIYIAVEGTPEAILAIPIAMINVVVYALTLGHLGVLSTDGFGTAFGSSASDSDMYWLFSDDSPKVWLLLILFAVIATLAAGVTLRLRSESAPRTNAHWVWTPVVFAVAGGLMTFLSTMSFGGGGEGSAGRSRSAPRLGSSWCSPPGAPWQSSSPTRSRRRLRDSCPSRGSAGPSATGPSLCRWRLSWPLTTRTPRLRPPARRWIRGPRRS